MPITMSNILSTEFKNIYNYAAYKTKTAIVSANIQLCQKSSENNMTLSIVFNKRPVIEPLQSAIINFFHCPSARCQPEPVLGSFVHFLVIFPVYMPARERVKSLKKKSDRV